MKNLSFIVFILLFLTGCDEFTDIDDTRDGLNPLREFSENGMLEYLGGMSMKEGPHDLLIIDNALYARRDNKLHLFDISSPATPLLKTEYTAPKNLGRMTAYANGLLVPGKDDGKLYQFDKNLNLVQSYPFNFNRFRANDILVDGKSLWISGSNGANGCLAKYRFQNQQLELLGSWTTSFGESLMESIDEKGNYIITSLANGDMLIFNKDSYEEGPTYSLDFDNEQGHGKWGKTVMVLNDYAYWANWGSGFITVSLSNMNNPYISHILSHSAFLQQFPSSNGTNVYDLDYNETHNLLCLANGWSGIFLVDPEEPGIVLDYISPQYLQNYSIATKGDYIYTGNISGGRAGDLKGLMVFKIIE